MAGPTKTSKPEGSTTRRTKQSGGLRRLRGLWRLQRDIPRSVYWGVVTLTVTTVAALWCLLTYGGLVGPLFLPSPGAVTLRLLELAQSGLLWQDTAISFYRVTVGFLISTAIAVPVGILMGTYRLAEAAVEPPVSLFRYMPAIAFIPLTILWVGIGDGQKFLIIFLGTFFQQVLLIMDNVKRVPRDYLNVGYTLGFNEGQILTRIVLPASAPAIFDSVRLTLGWAWTYLVVAELVAASSGLGYRIMEAQRYFRTDTIIVGILVIGVLGFIMDFAFKLAYRRFFMWAEQKK